jgi:hypothetical protein
MSGSELWANERMYVNQRPGDFGPATPIGHGPPGTSPYNVSIAPALADGGSAVVLVNSSKLLALSRTYSGPFERQTLASAVHAPAVSNDVFSRAVAVWVTRRNRIGAAYRGGGGKFGPVAQLASVPYKVGWAAIPPVVPAIAMDERGSGTIVWEESDGASVRLRLRQLAGVGAGPASTIGKVPTFVQEAPWPTCFPPGGRTLVRTARSVIVGTVVLPYTTTGCLFRRGVPIDLRWTYPYPVGNSAYVQKPPRLLLAGPYAAAVTEPIGHGGDVSTWISIVDLRDEATGLNRNGPAVTPSAYAEVPAIRLAANGAAAWVACGPFTSAHAGKCLRGGKRVKQVLAFGLDSRTPRVVGRGTRIDPRSLKLRGSRVVWQDGTRRRSAKL